MTTATLGMVAGYRATRDDAGSLIVHGVPIFVECERSVGSGDKRKLQEFDADWIKAAVMKAIAAEQDGYLPPLHVRHHGDDAEVRAAGFFRVLGAEQIQFKGESRLAVIADLVITDPVVQQEVLARRYPYRSVEIFNVGKPELNSLALLDHEAPFLQLPMLMVRAVESAQDVAGATVERNPTPTVAASFRRGRSAALLFQMGDDKPKPKDDEIEVDEQPKGGASAPTDEKPEDGGEQKPGEGLDEKGGEDVKATAPDAKSIVEAIKSGSISVADLQAIVQAIQERSNAGSGEDGQQGGPAPAPVPGQSMQADKKDAITMTTKTEETKTPTQDGETVVKMAALQGEVEGLKANLAQRDAADKRRSDVAGALKKLAGRPLGSDLETRLEKYHADHGPLAFAAHVEAIERTVGVLPTVEREGRFLANNAKVPPVAMKYQDRGPDAIDKAARFAAEWQQLRESGHARMSQERYVQIQMSANPLEPEQATA